MEWAAGDLVPGLHVTARDTPEVTRLKGSLSMLEVLTAAVADRQGIRVRLPVVKVSGRRAFPKTLRNRQGTVIQAANFPFWWL